MIYSLLDAGRITWAESVCVRTNRPFAHIEARNFWTHLLLRSSCQFSVQRCWDAIICAIKTKNSTGEPKVTCTTAYHCDWADVHEVAALDDFSSNSQPLPEAIWPALERRCMAAVLANISSTSSATPNFFWMCPRPSLRKNHTQIALLYPYPSVSPLISTPCNLNPLCIFMKEVYATMCSHLWLRSTQRPFRRTMFTAGPALADSALISFFFSARSTSSRGRQNNFFSAVVQITTS